jgi:two-component system sensor histidine kinase/response regulator
MTEPQARLLVVDDEAAQMKALCDTLEHEGYSATGYTSAAQALAALRPGAFDLLLTDLMMPEMDGIALMRSALQTDAQLVGIVMTGHGTIATAVAAMKAGALDYILKPFRLSSVLPVLERALTVRRLRVENAELLKRVEQRTVELEAANKELEAFSYTVSHDLRAPLRAVTGFSDILISDHANELSAEGQRLLNTVVGSAKRMEQLIEDLLAFSRLGRQPVAKRPLQFAVLVKGVMAEIEQQNSDRRVQFEMGSLPDCEGEVSLLKQVMVNLISNAFKFTRGREPAVIEVGSREEDNETVYYVRDNGAGFDMKFAQRLFGVFQRLHRAEDFEGTGIGLSIVQRIIQRHGGRVWAEGQVGEGATFYFSLPKK